jgi:O-antigen ligase
VLLAAGCVVVPCLFVSRLDESFVLPKLVALWAALAVALVLAARGVLRSERPGPASRLLPLDLAVGCFALSQVAAFAASTDHVQSLQGERFLRQGLLTTLLYVGFFALARVAFADLRRVRLLFVAIAAGATLVSAYAVVQWLGLDPVWESLPDDRAVSSLGQPNALAAYLVLAIPPAVVLAVLVRGGARLACAGAVAAMVAALFATESRGGYLGLLAAGIVLLVGLRQSFATRSRRLLALAVVVGAAGIGVLALAQSDRLSSAWDLRAVSSTRDHLDLWTVAAHVAGDHPLLGTGQETFPDQFAQYNRDVLPAERAAYFARFRIESPHNVYLGIAAGTGLPALAAYLAILATAAYALVRGARAAGGELRLVLVGVLAAGAGHLVTDAFMSPDLTGTWLFWVLLGSAAGVAENVGRP